MKIFKSVCLYKCLPQGYVIDEDPNTGIVTMEGAQVSSGDNGETILSIDYSHYVTLGTKGSGFWTGMFNDYASQTADTFIIKMRKTENNSNSSSTWVALSDSNIDADSVSAQSMFLGVLYSYNESNPSVDTAQQPAIYQYYNNNWNRTTYTSPSSIIPLNEWFYLKFQFIRDTNNDMTYSVEILNSDKVSLGKYSSINNHGVTVSNENVRIGYPRWQTGNFYTDVDFAETGFMKNNEWVWRPIKDTTS